MINTKREIDSKKLQNAIATLSNKTYHMNFNNKMKAGIKYKCEMSNNGDDQKVANLKEWIFGLTFHSGYLL